VVFIIPLLILFNSVSANDTDSLTLENTQYIKQRVNYLINQLEAVHDREIKNYKNFEELSKNLEKTQKEIVIAKNEGIDSLQTFQSQVSKMIRKNEKEQQKTNSIHYVLHILSLAFILFLVFYIVREKRKSLDYLISKTENLSGQNEEILEKAREMNKIKKNLKEMTKEQKKVRKKMKKK